MRVLMTIVTVAAVLGATGLTAGWFRNPAQEAAATFERGDFEAAATEFTDYYRKGVALYRAVDLLGLLEEEAVACVPGDAFGPTGE